MKLDLSKLFDKTVYSVEFEETCNLVIPKGSSNNHDIKLEKPVEIKGNVYLVEEGVYLSANLIYNYIENCDRCLIEFSNEVKTDLSAKIIEKSNQQVEENEDDEIIIYYNNEELEIEDTLISAFLWSLPMKSICKENCKGLCDICGKDLNLEQCKCTREEVDPRLAKLKDLLD